MKNFFLTGLFSLLLMSVCWAEGKVVLVSGEWPPYVSEKIAGQGFVTEIVSVVFKEAGIEIEYQFYPWLRCEKNLQNGEAYAVFPYIATEERKKII